MDSEEKAVVVRGLNALLGLCDRGLKERSQDRLLIELRDDLVELKMWAEAPSLCGECHGLTASCRVCGGRAFIRQRLNAAL